MTATSDTITSQEQAVIIGGGPAGLTAAYELTKLNIQPIVLEKLDKVGGLSRTENYKNFHFDMGGHRFFTKSEQVNQMWREILGEDLLLRPRLSRIYYNHKFFNYPLKPLNALLGLGIVQAMLVVLSYLRWQLFPYPVEDTFEQWVTNRFGRRLFLTFFKAYTEKLWGIPCTELKAEWAAQRIKDLSLKTAIVSMFLKPQTTIKTLIEEFHYPRFGPGMLWNAVKREIERRNGTVCLNSEVIKINRCGNLIESVVVRCDGHEEVIRGTDFISSMPVSEFIKKLDPPAPRPVLTAAEQLHYRDFLTVCLIVNKSQLFPDNWIYVHDPSVKVGRIQNFKNWSPDMIPDPTKTSLGLEYFCNEGDELWNLLDADLISLAKRELERIGLARAQDVEEGCVFRVEKSYPVYDSDYRNCLGTVRGFVESLDNFQTIGRNGLHRYNNQDHAMLTGMLAVRNMVLGEQHDLWSVNGEQEYHEEIRTDTPVGVQEVAEVIEETITHVFEKLDPVAFGLSVGIIAGLGLFLATLALVLKDGGMVGSNLRLLNEFFPGYSVTPTGSVVGSLYGFVVGFLGGWGLAFLRNTVTFLYMAVISRRVQLHLLRQVLDF
jgi:protoporphyrinogen oxidase